MADRVIGTAIGVTLLLRRRAWGPLEALGYEISGTSGRSQAQPTLQDLTAALAESKPLDAPTSEIGIRTRE